MPSLFELWLSNVPTFFMLLRTMLTLCRKVPVLNMTSLAVCLLAALFWLMLGSSPGRWPAPAASQVVSLSPSLSLLSLPELAWPGSVSVSGLTPATRQTPLAPPSLTRTAWPAELPGPAPPCQFLPAGLKPVECWQLISSVSCPVPFTKSCKWSVVESKE